MQAAHCANCGAPLVSGGLFCENCGARVEQAAPEKLEVAAPPPSPSNVIAGTSEEADQPAQPGTKPAAEVWRSPYRDELETTSRSSSVDDGSSYSSGSRNISRRSALGGIGVAIGVIVLLCRGASLLSRVSSQNRSTYTLPTPTPFAVTGTLSIYRGHTDIVWSVAWSPNGDTIASASNDGTVQLWAPTTGNKVLSYKGGFGPVMTAAWSPDGKRLASESFDELDVNDAATGRSVYVSKGKSYAIGTQVVSWSPDGKRIAFAGGNSVEIVDAETGTTLLTYTAHSNMVMAVAWSPDSKHVASGGQDKTAQIWDASTGKTLVTYKEHTDNVLSVAWSPDGKRIVSGSKDGTAQTWDTRTGQGLFSYTTHTDSVVAVAWSPNGKSIVTGSADKTAKVWSLETSSNTFTYTGHVGYVTSVAWSPDSTKVVSGSYDRSAQVWQPQ